MATKIIKIRRSIQTRMGLTLIVLTTVMLSGYGAYQYRALQSSSLSSLNEAADSMSIRLAKSLANPIWDMDRTTIEEFVVSEMETKHVFAILVKDDKGRLMSGKGRDEAWQIVEMPEIAADDTIVRHQKVEKAGTQVGAIELYLTKQFMSAELRHAVRTVAVTILGLDAALLIVLILSLRTILIHPIARLLKSAKSLAAGDFSQDILIGQQDEIGALATAFTEMQDKIAEIVREVKMSAHAVTEKSREMNAVSEKMSEGATQQAAATEEVSASMQEMAANIRQTADNARMTENMSLKSADDARAGKQAVTEIIQAMEVIAERISVIQEIASQTNILSLNATIEAAKAQEYGKGFAVVASSVRDLARESRSAAEEIRSLVHSCVILSAQAGEVLQRLVPNSEKTAELVQEICAASQEQSHGVEHVNQSVQQLDTVTQHNAGTAEELASTAESLTTQAEALQKVMAFFTVKAVQVHAPKEKQDILRLLQGIDKSQLVEFLTATLTAEPHSQTSSELPDQPLLEAQGTSGSESGVTFHMETKNTANDTLDQEFEKY